MEISTRGNSSISSFRCYSQYQAAESNGGFEEMFDDNYTFRTEFMDCEDEYSSMNPSVLSSSDCSDEGDDDSESRDEYSSGSGLRNKRILLVFDSLTFSAYKKMIC
ncbi:hypothetical protein KIN20_004952 [Parelaphostrongylus tenuis]|uniref:Uncharacterized protein n=1 Tax=Parelaphostrongylus tenuis TaxID=148309 RepID=A0AAD5QJP6_PARTN|nr:hypothetical protein KIN20_004952 [Parelaphostrongylus tenuis]